MPEQGSSINSNIFLGRASASLTMEVWEGLLCINIKGFLGRVPVSENVCLGSAPVLVAMYSMSGTGSVDLPSRQGSCISRNDVWVRLLL